MAVDIKLDETPLKIGRGIYGHFYGLAEYDKGNLERLHLETASVGHRPDLVLDSDDLYHQLHQINTRLKHHSLMQILGDPKAFEVITQWCLMQALDEQLRDNDAVRDDEAAYRGPEYEAAE